MACGMSWKYLIITVAVLAAYVLVLVSLAWYTTDGGWHREEHDAGEYPPRHGEGIITITTGSQ